MTNAEKFVEVFGTELKRQYATKSWWEQEYVPANTGKASEYMNKERAIEIIDKGLDIGKEMLFLTVDEMNEAKQMAIDAIGRDKGRCNWCSNISKRHFRIEYYWIDDEGNAASFNTKNGREVATGIAKFCPSCGRKLNIAER